MTSQESLMMEIELKCGISHVPHPLCETLNAVTSYALREILLLNAYAHIIICLILSPVLPPPLIW